MIYINLLHILMMAVLFVATVFTMAQTPSRIQNYLLILTVSVLVVIFGYTLEVNAQTLEAAMVGLKIGYVGKPFALLASFLFIVERYGYKKKFGEVLRTVLLVASVLITVLVFTSENHTLYYTSIEYVQHTDDLFPHLALGHGIFYHIYTVLIFFYAITETIIVLKEFSKARTKYERDQLWFVLGLVVVGALGFLVFLTGITRGYDTTILGCFLGGCFLLVLFLRYRFFDALSVVKEYALNNSDNGLIVLDPGNRTIYINAQASQIFPNIYTGTIPANIDELIGKPGTTRNYFWNDRVFQIQVSPLDVDDRHYGTSVELNDITDGYQYSQRLSADVAERTKDIWRIQRQITVGFANIVEARDGETGDHIHRTSRIVRIIADDLAAHEEYRKALTGANIAMLEETSPLHDVGKISIPDSILLKPDKLTPEEFEVMKKHTVYGKELIEHTMRGVERDEYVSMAEDIALYHHERWDGTGYPFGLFGENIPLCARIMSIADVYDALRSERRYKPPYTRAESIEIIRAERGKQFDPAVVDAFLRNLDKIERAATLQ